MLRIHPNALAEIREGTRYYKGVFPALASDFLAELDHVLELVADHPLTWPRIHAEVRKCVFARFPYSLIYLAQEDTLHILAILHHKRRPDYWLPRLKGGDSA